MSPILKQSVLWHHAAILRMPASYLFVVRWGLLTSQCAKNGALQNRKDRHIRTLRHGGHHLPFCFWSKCTFCPWPQISLHSRGHHPQLRPFVSGQWGNGSHLHFTNKESNNVFQVVCTMNLSSGAGPLPQRQRLCLHTMVLELGVSRPFPLAHSFLPCLTSCLYLFACVASWHDVPLTRLSSIQCCMGIYTWGNYLEQTHMWPLLATQMAQSYHLLNFSSIKWMHMLYDEISLVSCSSEAANIRKKVPSAYAWERCKTDTWPHSIVWRSLWEGRLPHNNTIKWSLGRGRQASDSYIMVKHIFISNLDIDYCPLMWLSQGLEHPGTDHSCCGEERGMPPIQGCPTWGQYHPFLVASIVTQTYLHTLLNISWGQNCP